MRVAPWGVLGALLISACRSQNAAPIQLVVGESADKQLSFAPAAAFAEYVEVPGSSSELRLTLAGYAASCERFISPGRGQPLVMVVIVTPAGKRLEPGTYGWNGHAAHGGTPQTPERTYAMPSARIGPRNFLFDPGGSIRVSEVNLERAGKIKGVLSFEFAGTAERQAGSIRGSFEAGLCRVRLAK
jgi:hypothetical protein